MPYVTCDGVRIFYRQETETDALWADSGVPLLLVHGFMQRSDDWIRAGYVNQFTQLRNAILVDARGHGMSDKPHDVADYRMELLVSDLVHVLDSLGTPIVDFMGYSFGAWVGFGMAKFAPERLRSVVLGGMHPYVRDPGPLNRRIDRFTRTGDALAEGGHHAELFPESVKAQFAENDIQALIALTTAIRDSEGFEEALDCLEAPGLIYAGEGDPAHSLAQTCAKWHSKLQFLSLPGLGHMEAWHAQEKVTPHILEFLARLR